jgi:hypothetical protein
MCFGGHPFLARSEGNDAVALVDAIWIGGDLGASGPGNHVDDFGKSLNDFFGFGLDFQRLGKRDAGQPTCADRDGSFIESWKEFRANKRHESRGSGQSERGGNDNQHGMAHARLQQREIDALENADMQRVALTRRLFQEKGRERRNERERKDERAEQREGDGKRERAEHLALEPFEGEKRQEHHDDDAQV